tara:strand:- start:106 stop:336 length:231 start_codon:yes stop_codon:yes gene_type:complete
MTIINGHILTREEEKEREELLTDWHNEPGTVYAVTASGILAPVPKSHDKRQEFYETNMSVDGADAFYGGFYDAVNE